MTTEIQSAQKSMDRSQAEDPVPEWILRIREQLTVPYAGLGMKENLDYNLNIYLDILEDYSPRQGIGKPVSGAGEKESNNWNVVLSVGTYRFHAVFFPLLAFQ